MSGCPRTDSKWWGWGANEKRTELTEAQLGPLRDELGADPSASREVPPIEAVKLPEARASAGCRRQRGGEGLLTDHEQRVRHSAGKSYPDLVRVRSGQIEHAPDAIVVPADRAARGASRRLRGEDVAVVPFGGGSSVVGGVEPRCGGRAR